MLIKRTMAEKEKKKSNIGKGILQFLIFIIVLWIGTVITEDSLIWILILILAFFWYCFISKDDANIFFDKEAILKRLKSSKTRWIWFIVLSIIFGYSSLGSYQWEYQEQIQNTVDNISNNLEEFNDNIDDTLNNTIIDSAVKLKEIEDKANAK